MFFKVRPLTRFIGERFCLGGGRGSAKNIKANHPQYFSQADISVGKSNNPQSSGKCIPVPFLEHVCEQELNASQGSEYRKMEFQ